MTIESIELWHRRARPSPTHQQFCVQLGCHFEEVAEMLATLISEEATVANNLRLAQYVVSRLADQLKSGKDVYALDRRGFLDSVADQVVTAVGAAHCANMQASEALRRVNASNWSKFDDDGMPIFDNNGKVSKGPNYKAVDLTGLF